MITGFTRAGKYHKNDNEKNEDYIDSEENSLFCVISLSDGISSCKKSRDGAKLSCISATKLLAEKAKFFFNFKKQDSAMIILNQILYKLKEKSKFDNQLLEDYSGTIACALYDKKNKKLFVLSLGDSLILSAGKNGCKVLAFPSDSSKGCLCTTTENAEKFAYINIYENFQDEAIYIFSDGAWKELFNGNILKSHVKKILEDKNYDELISFLNDSQSYDDQSFISMNIGVNKGRKVS